MLTEPSVQTDRIRERMKVLGLNPYSAAKKAGLGESFVRDIIRGKVKQPSAERLSKLAVALECSLNYLLGSDEVGILYEGGAQGRSAPPAPLAPDADAAQKKARLLPIRYELIADALRKATDVSRPPLGWEAATIPRQYQDRASWWELVRDETMARYAPPGSLVQVVEFSNEERDLIGDGDLVIITKRLMGPDAAFHFVERSMRRVNYRYPDLGLWFLDFAYLDPEMDESDDVFRQAAPTAPRKSLAQYADEIEDPEERAEAHAYNQRLADIVAGRAKHEPRIQDALDRLDREMRDPKFTEKMAEADRWRPKLVGKVIRVLTAVDASARFGIGVEQA